MSTEGTIVRETLRYVNQFQGKTLVVAYGEMGDVASEDIRLLAVDLRLLSAVGIKVVLAGNEEDEPLTVLRNILTEVEFAHVANDAELIAFSVVSQAVKICLVCNVDSLFSEHGAISDLHIEDAEELLREEDVSDAAEEMLRFAIAACRAGIPRVHLFNAHRHNALFEELFTGHGAGTMIYTGTHKEVRTALPEDALAIACVLYALFRQGDEVDYVEHHLAEFKVFVADGDIYGCCRIVLEEGFLRVCSLAHTSRLNVAEVLQGLLEAILEDSVHIGVPVVIPVEEIPPLMSIQPWFYRLGFRKERLAAKKGNKLAWVAGR